MARIPERNPRFRTKDQIASDLAVILNSPVSWGTQHAVIAEALWVWSEFDGKYAGCKNWSIRAWANRRNIKGLRHDHAVPKKVLIAQLRELAGHATPEKVRDLFNHFCIGVVITLEEDRLLTKKGFNSALPAGETDPWSRYKAAGISLRVDANQEQPSEPQRPRRRQ